MGTPEIRKVFDWQNRYVVKLLRQGPNTKMHTRVDTDHAGCLKTRQSTSGGIIKLGRVTIKTWNLTQAVIAQSSGEAEYYGMVKGASLSIGIQSVLKDIWGRTSLYTSTRIQVLPKVLRRGKGLEK